MIVSVNEDGSEREDAGTEIQGNANISNGCKVMCKKFIPQMSCKAISDDDGLLSACMPSEFGPWGMKPGVCLLFVLLMWILLLEFCAMCVSDKLTVADNGVKCGWEKYCFDSACIKYKDMGTDDGEKNKDAGNLFIGFAILSFLLLIAMVPIVCDMHFNFCDGINACALNLCVSGILWIFMTGTWQNWVTINTCSDFNGSKLGDGTNLVITAWFFLTFFYIPLSIPTLQRMLFGENSDGLHTQTVSFTVSKRSMDKSRARQL